MISSLLHVSCWIVQSSGQVDVIAGETRRGGRKGSTERSGYRLLHRVNSQQPFRRSRPTSAITVSASSKVSDKFVLGKVSTCVCRAIGPIANARAEPGRRTRVEARTHHRESKSNVMYSALVCSE